MELSLEWLESQRAVMDTAHIEAGWFLRFNNGSVFNHARQVRDYAARVYSLFLCLFSYDL